MSFFEVYNINLSLSTSSYPSNFSSISFLFCILSVNVFFGLLYSDSNNLPVENIIFRHIYIIFIFFLNILKFIKENLHILIFQYNF